MKKLILSVLLAAVMLPVSAYELKKVTGPLTIDGKAEPVWNNAPELKLVLWRSNKAAPLMPSTVKFLYDDANLYCFAKFTENNLNEARMQSVKYSHRDAPVHQNDCGELFIDPFMDGKRCFQLVVDVHGTMADFLHGDPKNFRSAVNWDGFWRGEVHYSEEAWCIEYAIPWSTLGIAPGKNRKFAVDLSRSRRCNPPERSVLVDTRLLRTTLQFIKMSADIDPLPLTGKIEFGALFPGKNRLLAVLENATAKPLKGTLQLYGSYNDGKTAFLRELPVTIPVGKELKVPVDISIAAPGAVSISGNVILADKQNILVGSASVEVMPPFDINDPHPIVFQGEKWGVYLRIFTAGNKDVTVEIFQANRLAARKSYKTVEGKKFIPLPVEKLPPGDYRMDFSVNKDKIQVPLKIVARP